MANIENELSNIANAVYGEEVRGSIYDGISKINTETEDAIAQIDPKVNVAMDTYKKAVDDAIREFLENLTKEDIVNPLIDSSGTEVQDSSDEFVDGYITPLPIE